MSGHCHWVVVPTLGWSDRVAAAVDSVRGGARVLLVVDGDGEGADRDDLLTVRLDRRSGFGAACNRGFAELLSLFPGEADGTVLFLNDDALLPEQWTDAMAELEDPAVGAVGFATRGPGGARRAWPGSPTRRGFVHAGPTLDGCAFALRSRSFEQLGGFDESYGMYGEETDLFSRLQRNGMQLLEVPLEVWHDHEQSTSRLPAQRLWWAMRSPLRHALLNEPWHIVARRIAGTLVHPLTPVARNDAAPHVQRRRSGPLPLRVLFAFAAIAQTLALAPVVLVTGRRRARSRRGDLSRHVADTARSRHEPETVPHPG